MTEKNDIKEELNDKGLVQTVTFVQRFDRRFRKRLLTVERAARYSMHKEERDRRDNENSHYGKNNSFDDISGHYSVFLISQRLRRQRGNALPCQTGAQQ